MPISVRKGIVFIYYLIFWLFSFFPPEHLNILIDYYLMKYEGRLNLSDVYTRHVERRISELRKRMRDSKLHSTRKFKY